MDARRENEGDGRGSGGDLAGLRRGAGSQRLRHGSGAPGIERLEAAFVGQAFAPHRHDTYAIGVTLHGVQAFRYRGEQRYCRVGEGHILHPDETHDGAAGTQAGFGYRILYVEPALVQEAMGGRALPFVADPVIGAQHMGRLFARALAELDGEIDEFMRLELMLEVVDLLERHARVARERRAPLALAQLARLRALIDDEPGQRHSLALFEQISGLDRWTIARQFRAAYGTSPTRYRTMRQLDRSRALMRAGMPLAQVALEAGFADQSHFSRMFKRAYGMSSSAWLAWSRPWR